MFEILIGYADSGKRYIFPFEIVEKTLKLTASDKKKLEQVVLEEVQKL